MRLSKPTTERERESRSRHCIHEAHIDRHRSISFCRRDALISMPSQITSTQFCTCPFSSTTIDPFSIIQYSFQPLETRILYPLLPQAERYPACLSDPCLYDCFPWSRHALGPQSCLLFQRAYAGIRHTPPVMAVERAYQRFTSH
jgi:hypothetical protein